MKAAVAVLLFALVAMACCQAPAATGGDLTPDQVVEKLTGIYGEGACIPLGCKRSCWAAGHKSGYCLNNACTCVVAAV
ncbi:hypothetical protein NQ315_012679 [Exocentrus adspersus]|uniref:Uncharacterized protein n=1 Tax=Exocentrus adspersus TaxID=1586481 RepID=A0AAV8VT21_9CUCU|nr:hypothetical protein NQ315_012679 [Exocentrus adspersus]